jgi:streptomycin 3"-adenylyltransferase
MHDVTVAAADWTLSDAAAAQQLHALVAALIRMLGHELVGVYLHGSLAMGCFNPARSDLDLLVVTTRPASLNCKCRLVATLLRSSGAPYPIEISFLVERDLAAWQHPFPYDLHFSEHWRSQLRDELASGAWRRWNAAEQRDDDLAAHFTILHARGIVLLGPPIAGLFPTVPSADYRTSIRSDLDWARDRIATDPIYAILNACRVLTYWWTQHVCSKSDGAEWVLGTQDRALDDEDRQVIQAALDVYCGRNVTFEFNAARTEAAFNSIRKLID